ncbi:hypothetical protein YB2330_001119 [Saitoella coloradoensis]
MELLPLGRLEWIHGILSTFVGRQLSTAAIRVEASRAVEYLEHLAIRVFQLLWRYILLLFAWMNEHKSSLLLVSSAFFMFVWLCYHVYLAWVPRAEIPLSNLFTPTTSHWPSEEYKIVTTRIEIGKLIKHLTEGKVESSLGDLGETLWQGADQSTFAKWYPHHLRTIVNFYLDNLLEHARHADIPMSSVKTFAIPRELAPNSPARQALLTKHTRLASMLDLKHGNRIVSATPTDGLFELHLLKYFDFADLHVLKPHRDDAHDKLSHMASYAGKQVNRISFVTDLALRKSTLASHYTNVILRDPSHLTPATLEKVRVMLAPGGQMLIEITTLPKWTPEAMEFVEYPLEMSSCALLSLERVLKAVNEAGMHVKVVQNMTDQEARVAYALCRETEGSPVCYQEQWRLWKVWNGWKAALLARGTIERYAIVAEKPMADVAKYIAGRYNGVIYVNNNTLRGFFRIDKSGKHGFLVVFTAGDKSDPKGRFIGQGITEDRAATYLRTAIASDVEFTIDLIAPWKAVFYNAETFMRDRVILCGDAASTVTPHGGSSGNTGIQATHNLA